MALKHHELRQAFLPVVFIIFDPTLRFDAEELNRTHKRLLARARKSDLEAFGVLVANEIAKHFPRLLEEEEEVVEETVPSVVEDEKPLAAIMQGYFTRS